MTRVTATFAACLLIFFAAVAQAHEPSKSYLSLTFDSNQVTGQWDIPLRDVQTVVPLDLDADGIVTWEKLHARYHAITDYAFAHLQISFDGKPVSPHITDADPAIEEFSDGSYLRIPFTIIPSGEAAATATNGSQVSSNSPTLPLSSGERVGVRADVSSNIPLPDSIELSYHLFFETNSLHRGLFRLETNGKTQDTAFSPDHTTQSFQLAAPSPGRQFLVFLREGIWHIWTGYDHILFLLALLLPSVLHRDAGKWRAVDRFRPAVINILKIVTAFTLAHSLTLTLATLGLVKIPSRITESAIAISVVLAAANNLWPLIRERGWMVAFGFGLIHGFGFASALGDLGLAQSALWLTLVGFNLGVETGQLAIVAVFLPLAFWLRRTWFYRVPLLGFGSAGIMLVAGIWFSERVFDFKVLPF